MVIINGNQTVAGSIPVRENSPYSIVVVRRTCNAKVGGSIPPKGNLCRDSIAVSIPACHAGDPGSIPGRGYTFLFLIAIRNKILKHYT